MQEVLAELDVPAHHRRPQARLQRWLYYRYHRRPDNGARESPAQIRAWARDLGVVEAEKVAEMASVANGTLANDGIPIAGVADAGPQHTQRPMELCSDRLLQLCRTVLCADRAHARQAAGGGGRPDPRRSLLHAVAQTECRVFDPTVQLFPHDLQWVVAASAAAPAQFTPSMTALEAELEAYEATCASLEEARLNAVRRIGQVEGRADDAAGGGGGGGEGDRDGESGEASLQLDVDAMLQRATRVSMKIGEDARMASRLLQTFSTEYAPQISSWTSPSLDNAVAQNIGPLAKVIAQDLSTIIGVLENITVARKGFDTFAGLPGQLERIQQLSENRFDHSTMQESVRAGKIINRFRAQLDAARSNTTREKKSL